MAWFPWLFGKWYLEVLKYQELVLIPNTTYKPFCFVPYKTRNKLQWKLLLFLHISLGWTTNGCNQSHFRNSLAKNVHNPWQLIEWGWEGSRVWYNILKAPECNSHENFIVKSQIQPNGMHLSITDNSHVTNLNIIFLLQKRAVRIITNSYALWTIIFPFKDFGNT